MYSDKKQVEYALQKINGTGNSYFCEHCLAWHMTSKKVQSKNVSPNTVLSKLKKENDRLKKENDLLRIKNENITKHNDILSMQLRYWKGQCASVMNAEYFKKLRLKLVEMLKQ
jgi:ribosomal protein S13